MTNPNKLAAEKLRLALEHKDWRLAEEAWVILDWLHNTVTKKPPIKHPHAYEQMENS